MKLEQNQISNSGFTLMEVLIVMAIFALVSGFALVVSMDSYRSHNFGSEQNMLLGILLKARSQAVNNINQAPHGVRITNSNYSLFQGATYSPGTDFPVSNGFTPSITPPNTDIVFDQLTGQVQAASPTITVTLQDNSTGKTFNILINHEGQINY